MKVLLVEDDIRIAEPLEEELRHHQFLVQIASDGAEALHLALHEHFDLILLDVMLPNKDGFQVCRELRQNGSKAAIIMLTAKDKTEHKIMGLDAGADDYLVKPFEIDELLARIRAVLRRDSNVRKSLLQHGALQVDEAMCKVTFEGNDVSLTPTEYRLLTHFLRHPKQTFTKDQLVDRLWLPEAIPSDSVVKAHIKGLRKNLKASGATKDVIETVYGFGYRLKDDA